MIAYAPTSRGARLNLVRTALESSIRLMKRVAGEGQLASSLKRRFRERAGPPASAA